MSLDERVTVLLDYFTSSSDGDLLSDRPQWRSLEGAASPVCYQSSVIAPESGVTGVQHGAIAEGTYPLSQYARMELYDTDAGNSYDAQGVALGLRASGSSEPELTGYRVNLSDTDDEIYLFRFDPLGDGTSLVGSFPYSPQRNDVITAEVKSDGSGGCDFTLYDQDEVVIGTANDAVELVGGFMYVAMSYTNLIPSLLAVEFGYLDVAANRQIDNVNIDFAVKSLGNFQANGAGLVGVTGGNISFSGLRPFEIVLAGVTDSQVNIQPIDISQTQLQFGVLRLTLYHPDGDLTIAFDQFPEDGWQYVTLAGATGNYIDKDISAVDGDQICMPTGVQFSSVLLFADGDVHFDGALNQGQEVERRLYDLSAFTWDAGIVTIDQAAVGVAPIWRSTPAPPNASVGVPYSYAIGYLVDGDRPMTLRDVGVQLPYGLAYNNTTYPETIEGTIISGSGTITVSGIITEAENDVV